MKHSTFDSLIPQDANPLEIEYLNSNLAIVNMLDDVLAEGNYVIVENDQQEYEIHKHTETESKILISYKTRSAAYLSALSLLWRSDVLGGAK